MSAHTWKFARIGGFDQVEISSGEDLAHLRELDQKLWVALACPVKGIEFDERTLELIDKDKDGRIRANELISAADWACSMVKDLGVFAKGHEGLALSAVDESKPEGKRCRASMKAMLKTIGKSDAKTITVEDTSAAIASFRKRPANGDGIVTVVSTTDATTQQLIADAIACTAPVPDASGDAGIKEDVAAGFLAEINAHHEWLVQGEAIAKTSSFEGAVDAYAAISAVRNKVDDFFARTRVAAFDPRAANAVNRPETDYIAIAAKDLDAAATEMEAFPLAHIAPDAPLPLEKGVNPAWRERIAALREKAIKPALGDRTSLTAADWRTLQDKLAAHHAWATSKKGASVEKLGEARVKEIAVMDAKERFDKLYAAEKEAEPLAAAIESVEQLVRYVRDLMPLAKNFVSFRDFYVKKTPGTFQAGTLYLDQRSCDLCVPVADAGRHTSMAPRSNIYLVYCDIKNAKGETGAIAAAVTGGDVDNLMVGRNGVFYDRKGGDWDATITKIIDNPISVSQAFWKPYKKILQFVEEQISKRIATAEAEADAKTTANSTAAAAAADGKAPAPAPTEASKIDVGTVAALGVAVGGITAALGAILGAFFGLGIWMPLGVLGILLAISGPAMAVAWLKLRQRNLGPLLDANGWALNANARLNVPFGGSLTQVAELPAGAQRTVDDPFAEKRNPWRFYLVMALLFVGLVCWYLGKLDRFLPNRARSTSILGTNAPAYVAPPPAPAPAP